MSKRTIQEVGALGALLSALALGPLLAGPAPAQDEAPGQGEPASAEPVLRDREHEAIGTLMGNCIASLSDPRIDRVAAQAALREEFDKLERRRTGDRPMLALTQDLGRSLWLAQGYARQRVRAGSVEAFDTKSPFGDTVQYAVWVPQGYAARRGESYPVLFILPDAPTPGQATQPRQFLTENWAEPLVRQNALLVAVGMPEAKTAEDVKKWSALGEQGLPGMGANLLTALMEVTRKYAVDFDRIYLVAHGAAVEPAMLMASKFPDRFAGMIGRRGDAAELAPSNFKNLPTLFTGAGTRATAFAEAAKQAGQENVTLSADASEADIWAWIQKHPRRANPAEVLLVPGAPFPHKAYWLEVPPSDGATPARILARIDRANNTVVIESRGVSEVTLFFNDDLLDLDRPVRVISNGRTHPEEVIPRNFSTFVSLIYGGRNDPGKLYVANKRYDVTEQ